MWAAARPQLQVASKYALAEMTPPKLSDIPAIRSGECHLSSGSSTENIPMNNLTVLHIFICRHC